MIGVPSIAKVQPDSRWSTERVETRNHSQFKPLGALVRFTVDCGYKHLGTLHSTDVCETRVERLEYSKKTRCYHGTHERC